VDGRCRIAKLIGYDGRMYFKLEITRYVLHEQPGFVECRLLDAHGKEWTFISKLPYVTLADLDGSSDYPQPGTLECELIRYNDDGTLRIAAEFSPGLGSYIQDFQLDLRPQQIVGPVPT